MNPKQPPKVDLLAGPPGRSRMSPLYIAVGLATAMLFIYLMLLPDVHWYVRGAALVLAVFNLLALILRPMLLSKANAVASARWRALKRIHEMNMQELIGLRPPEVNAADLYAGALAYQQRVKDIVNEEGERAASDLNAKLE